MANMITGKFVEKGDTKVDKQTVLDAIKGEGLWSESGTSGGNISAIARRIDVWRRTVYLYQEKWPEVKEAIEEEREALLDFAESQLFKQIKSGNIAAIIFTLKTRGKERGYVERQEFTGKDGGTLMINWERDVDNNSD